MNLMDIKGIGKKKLQLLNKLGIFTVTDLLEYFPYAYVDTSKFTTISEIFYEGFYSYRLKIENLLENKKIKNLIITKFLASDEKGDTCTIVYFNNPFISKSIKSGNIYSMYGKAKKIGKNIEIQTPVLQNNYRKIGTIIPQYHLTKGISNLDIVKIMKNLLENDSIFEESLSMDILNRYNLIGYKNAIKNIHFPNSMELYNESKRRLIFEEFLFFQLQMKKLKDDCSGFINFEILDETDKLIKTLPFELTNSQREVLTDIFTDMEDNRQMNRLIQGDVGSGKTILALISAFNVIKNSYQCAFMAPTEILARQHYENAVKLFKDFGIKTEILVGSLKESEKRDIYSRLENGEIDLLIGTHAIFQEKVNFDRLGLVITDEQHRFGVKQRLLLSKKAENPDILVMSATPIPRTVGLVLFCDLDISSVKELPKGRGKINTYFVGQSYEERFMNFIKEHISQGRQAYIVCPLVDESETMDLQSVILLYERLKQKYFSNINIEFIHGKLNPTEKNRIMESFEQNKTKVLISTTVIEVGINVPNANIMVIYDADRFGLSQIHQLRGRIGRGNHESYCILVSNKRNENIKKRMEIICSSTDGFYISEQDFLLRGYGDIFGYRQSGIAKFKLSDIQRDFEIFKESRDALEEIIKKDKNLEKIENRQIRKKYDKINEKFKNNIIMN